jgi:hypothetical protein
MIAEWPEKDDRKISDAEIHSSHGTCPWAPLLDDWPLFFAPPTGSKRVYLLECTVNCNGSCCGLRFGINGEECLGQKKLMVKNSPWVHSSM